MNHSLRIHKLKRVTIFVGAYGSGKSEVSTNYALWLTGQPQPVCLADLDTINPFYRSADAEQRLTAAGVQVIKPVFANTNVDVPAVGGDIYRLFDDRTTRAVLDIGGEDLGVRIVASLRSRILSEETDMYMVVNLNRPFSSTAEELTAMATALATTARLPVTGLVDNTHLFDSPDRDMLTASLQRLRPLAETIGIPVVFRSALDEHVPAEWGNTMPDGTPILRMERTIHYNF